ncbi:MAG: hypothetical protein RLZZ225_20 [Pseudomonadota bacterium]
MLILSTFNSDYLKSPLQHLIEKFTTESVEVKYVNNNIVAELISLGSSVEPPSSIAILLRLVDLSRDCKDEISQNQLKENLQLIFEQINVLKQKKSLPFIVFLSPSPETFYDEALLHIEKCFLESLQNNKIHTLTQSDIKKYYLLTKLDNPVERDTHIPYTPEFYMAKACLLARKLHLLLKKDHKVIVVDCDNTLWTGVAGDIGAENVFFEKHNLALQKFLMHQSESGIIICLCSKNEEQTVLDVFNKRQEEMPLKINQVTKYKVNWDRTSTNIANLASELNLSLDSFIFIDDNPWEIEEVNSQIPGILCVTMPQSLHEFNHTWAFDINEHLLITETDRNRSEFYKQAETKIALATRFRDPIEYLRSSELGLSIVISKVDSVNDIKTIERVCKLAERTNQFNLFPETKKLSEIEIKEMVISDKKEVFVGRISDKFSPEDITAIALCTVDESSLKVDGFFVSCRSFGRGIEYELIKHMAQFAQAKQLTNIEIKFKKTAKNKVATTFLHVLSEKINKNLISSRPNFSVLEVGEVFNLTLPIEKLRDLQIDSLVRATLNANQLTKIQPDQKISLNSHHKVSERYLVELREMTQALDYLMREFSVDIRQFEPIVNLKDKIFLLCADILKIINPPKNKSLVSLGLDSLKATLLGSSLYESEGVTLCYTQLLRDEVTISTLIARIEEQKAIKKTVTDIIMSEAGDSYYDQNIPVSLQQKRLWVAEQKEGVNNSSNYHMLACYTTSNLNINHFGAACQQIIERYDVFGATFFMDKDGQVVQSVLPSEKRLLKLEIKDLGEGESLQIAIQNVIAKPLSMSDYPLIRFVVFKDQANKNYHILFHIHHSIFDAVSLKNCLDDLSKLYANALTLTPLKLPTPPVYIEFIQVQRKKIEDKDHQERAKKYWSKQLSKIETVTEFPSDQVKLIFKPATEQEAERYIFSSSEDDFTALKALAQSAGVTCYSVLSALFSILICAYTYQDKVAMITATNGRSGNPSFYKMIGFFVNLLVQSFDLEDNKDKTFNEYLKDNHQKWLDAQDFQDIPFEEIQKILSEQGIKDILLSPALIYQSYDIPQLILADESATLTIPERPIIFDLRKFCRFGSFTLFVQDAKDSKNLNFIIEYAKDLYSADFIERIANNFKHLMATVVHNPEQRLEEISVVCERERKELLSLSQGPELKYRVNNLVEGFQRSVEKHPNNIAICHNEIKFSYTKLDQLSNNLAIKLFEKGVKKGDNVGISCHRNHLFFIAELAILKLGAVFVPLSIENPDDRLHYIIKHAEINYIIGDVDLTLKDTFIGCKFIDIQSITEQVAAESFAVLKEKFQQETNMEDRACILYTSGSTGDPKGVILKHKGIFRVVESANFLMVTPNDKVGQMANEAFDAAQLECWLAWNNAARLVIIDKEVMLSAKLFSQQLLGQKITIMWLTAGLFHHYAYNQPDLFKQLSYLLVGGDAIDKQAVQDVLKVAGEAPLRIINGYGPTETSIFALTYTFDLATLNQYDKAPVGRPINNTTVEVLTQFRQLVPIGGAGQLYIGGEGLAEGYLKLPDIAKKCFISDEKMLESRKYKSGDLVKWSVNCLEGLSPEIIFLQRVNNEQRVKIQGNLVFVDEIKNVFLRQPSIKQAEILINEHDKNKFLLAFYTVKENLTKLPTSQDLYDYLHNKLPHYMIPAFYKQIESFPTNLNGKLDRKKLLAYPLESYSKELSEEILTENEQKLLALFKNVLSFNPGFTVSDDFFQHGGTSIQAIQLIAEVKNIFNKDISFDHLRQNSSVKSLVRFLELENNQLLTGSLLSVLKEGDRQLPPVVFIHPAGGGLSCFDQLIKALQFPNSCFGIEDPVIQEAKIKALSMQEMATDYVERIKREINGPFILAGYSFGGMLALEMAAQLERQEARKVQNDLLGVILLDTWVVSCASEGVKSKLKEQVLAYCAEQREKASRNQDRGQGLSTSMDLLKEICSHHQEIGFVFKPEKIVRTFVCLLKATELSEEFLEMGVKERDNYLLNFIDKKLFKKQEIEATHFNLLENLSLPSAFFEQVSELCQKSKCCSPKVISIDLSDAEKYSGNAAAAFFKNTRVNEIYQCDNEKPMLRIAK